MRLLGFVGFTAYMMPLQAQTTIDAGSILRQQPLPPAAAPLPAQRIMPAQPAADQAESGPRTLVKGFRIQGAVLISETELVAQLQGSVGQELSLRQLEGAAAALTAYYVQRGYLARVLVPPQDVKDGIVTLQVIEGRRGGVRVTPKGDRIDAQQVAGFIDYRLARGAVMDIGQLGEALNIINEQSGVSARATIAPGQGEGEIDLIVNASSMPWTQPFANLNNYGLVGTGETQISGGVTINNASGHFDEFTLMANAAEGSGYARADYSVPVGSSGLRMGINVSHLRYDIVQHALAALDAHGSASTSGISFSYPLARRDDFHLSLLGSIDEKRLIDNTVAGETSNRRIVVAGLSVTGYVVGGMLPPDSITSFSVGTVTGESKQRNPAAHAADQASRKTQGALTKLLYSLGYLLPLPDDWRLNTNLRGQIANGNLDSSERFSLGGPSGVRAYSIGEAIGDEGWLLNLNLSRTLYEGLSASLFYDLGGVTLNRRTWSAWNAGNPGLDNRYTLAAAGIGLEWRISANALLSTSIATALGNNPGRDASGKNADGKDNRTRGWVSLTAQF